MDLTYLLVADYANITGDGKLNVMGIFSIINAHGFPAVHPQMYLVAQLTAGPFEYGRKCDIVVKLLDQDGSELVDFKTPVEVPVGEKGQRVHLNHMVQLVNLSFPRPGTYEFGILVDNEPKGTLPIQVNQVQPSPQEP
jgi:hypothetical protein